MSRKIHVFLSTLALVAARGAQLFAAEPAKPGEVTAPAANQAAEKLFLRVTRDDNKKPQAMETSIVRYVPKDPKDPKTAGLSVELVSAVHVGEKGYYEQLNKQFEKYDALLFELVAKEGTKIPKGGGERRAGGNPVSMLQNGMKSILNLEYQLTEVDYTKPNFVHADLSPDEFAKSMERRGESFWTIFMQLMAQGMARAKPDDAGSSEADLVMALFDKNRAIKLKIIVAEQFEDLDSTMVAFNGPDGSTLITERNKAALAVLKKQIDGGKKKIGIFYGAGHMSDMSERLEKEFGLQRESTRWLTAWDLKLPPKVKAPAKNQEVPIILPVTKPTEQPATQK